MEIFQELDGQGNTIVMITHDPEVAERAKRCFTSVMVKSLRVIGSLGVKNVVQLKATSACGPL